MAKTLGYLITWTTYGAWLQGDKRGYVKDGNIFGSNSGLLRANKQNMVRGEVRLSETQRKIVKEAILEKAQKSGQEIYALSVNTTHVHVISGYTTEPISKIVAYYKTTARLALKVTGHEGKLWTKGYDKRFCFDEETLRRRIKYVLSHNK